jgi:hypothetical protein
MSVLIKGMEPPASCFDCPFMYGRKYCRANSKIEFNDPNYSELKGRYDGCPLIPVSPHGDLISRSALIADLMDRGIEGIQTDDWHEIQQAIMDAPTIIEADEMI